MSNSTKKTSSKPSNRRTSSDDSGLSLDTRLAAQEILNDDSIGIGRSEPRPTRQRPILEWLEPRRTQFTVIILALASLLTIIPVWLEVGQREHSIDLQATLSEEATKLQEIAGAEALKRWIESRDVDRLRDFFSENRSQILARLASTGFELKADDLSVRVDYDNGVLYLGALVNHGDEGRFMTWAGTDSKPPVHPLPTASFGSVFSDKSDMLTVLGVIVAVLTLSIWFLPMLGRYESDQSERF